MPWKPMSYQILANGKVYSPEFYMKYLEESAGEVPIEEWAASRQEALEPKALPVHLL